jgi:hypothetical protein
VLTLLAAVGIGVDAGVRLRMSPKGGGHERKHLPRCQWPTQRRPTNVRNRGIPADYYIASCDGNGSEAAQQLFKTLWSCDLAYVDLLRNVTGPVQSTSQVQV